MQPVTLVYIEDNSSNMTLVSKIIELVEGFSMVGATTGSEGIELVRSQMPDIVLLDLNLPDMNGFAVLQVLRADPARRGWRGG